MKIYSIILIGAAFLVFAFPAGKSQDFEDAQHIEEDMAAQPPFIYRPYRRQAINNRQFGFNLGIGDKDNGVNVGVDKDKGVDVGVTVGGKKIVGSKKTSQARPEQAYSIVKVK
ncbi:unnamed protein product [Porites evermanni]|uniref:Uncharacterized protein n=1 Tax=Porites evermanni TaxID=104178 RepID=A0ABN8NAD6_9CNID|nr:unnamed protein product [Porites evermanni]